MKEERSDTRHTDFYLSLSRCECECVVSVRVPVHVCRRAV